MHPVQEQLQRLAELGYLTEATDLTDEEKEDVAEGNTHYRVLISQEANLFVLLKRPAMWEESLVLRECKDALAQLREQAIQLGDIEA